MLDTTIGTLAHVTAQDIAKEQQLIAWQQNRILEPLIQLYLHLRTRDNLPASLALYRARLWLNNINYFKTR